MAGFYYGLPWPWILVSGIVGGSVVAAGVDRLIYRPLAHTSNILLLVSGIGASIVLRHSIAILFGDQFKSIEPFFGFGVASIGPFMVPVSYLAILLAVVILTVMLWFGIMRTQFGRKVRAISNDPELARTSGINVPVIITWTFVIAGAYAGLAGVLAALIRDATPEMGFNLGLKAFTASVLGGIGSIPGCVIASLGLGMAEALVIGIWGSRFHDAPVFGLLIVGLLTRPQMRRALFPRQKS